MRLDSDVAVFGVSVAQIFISLHCWASSYFLATRLRFQLVHCGCTRLHFLRPDLLQSLLLVVISALNHRLTRRRTLDRAEDLLLSLITPLSIVLALLNLYRCELMQLLV